MFEPLNGKNGVRLDNKKNLQQINDVSLEPDCIGRMTIKKQLLCMFIAEVLLKIMKTSMIEQDLFDYIWFVRKNMSKSNLLNNNYGIVLLIKISEILGFGPLKKSMSNAYFHLELGEFVDFYNKKESIMDKNRSDCLKKILNNNLAKTTYKDRKMILEDMILYFKIHDHELKNLTSHLIIESLRE